MPTNIGSFPSFFLLNYYPLGSSENKQRWSGARPLVLHGYLLIYPKISVEITTLIKAPSFILESVWQKGGEGTLRWGCQLIVGDI